MNTHLEFLDGDRTRNCHVTAEDGVWRVSLDDAEPVTARPAADGVVEVVVDGRRRRAWTARRDGERFVFLDGRVHVFRLAGDDAEDAVEIGVGGPRVTAEMPGKVVKVSVAVGDEVAAGDPLLILEAMKMETELAAPLTGRVAAVHVAAGQTVGLGELLLEIEPEADADDGEAGE